MGDLPLAVQVKLLRFLQEQTFMRVCGRQNIQSDARIIAATNVDLRQATTNGTFREDLYFRLTVVIIELPPLRNWGKMSLRSRHSFSAAMLHRGRTKLSPSGTLPSQLLSQNDLCV